MGFVLKNQATLLADMTAWIVANSAKVTDFTPGSIIRSFCEATSLCLDDIYISTYLAFTDYLNTLKTDIFGFVKKTGTVGTTDVIFSRAGTSGVITIPIGTRVSTGTDLIYETTEVATIGNGNNDSNAVEVESEKIGLIYNVSAASINILKDNLDGVDTVTNAVGVTGGTDEESDFDFQTRFQAYMEGLGRCNLAGVTAGALSYAGITSVSIQEHFPAVANVNATVYIDDGSVAGVTATQIADVQEIIDGDGTETYPGYRGIGVNIVVEGATITTQDVVASFSMAVGLDADSIISAISTACTNYINHLGVGNDIIYNKLVSTIMGVFGVTNCVLTTPAADGVIAATSTARLGTPTITET